MSESEIAYHSALDYLYSFVDYSLKHSSELAKADFNLDRMFALMDLLGNPQAKYPIIHVAGSKGKGSVCALAASALRAAGFTTGLYTSPHLIDFCERIQIDGQPIPHALLVELVDEIKPAVARVEKLTTFEITTALGLMAFERQGASAVVLEVGLGGRLDATNIVTPRVSVITSISYDHTAVLGDTLTLIAGEKAGIIKPNVPVVSAPQKAEALNVLVRVATEMSAPFTLVGQDVEYKPLEHSLAGQTLNVWFAGEPSTLRHSFNTPAPVSSTVQGGALNLQLPLLGIHQVENAAVAYAALRTSRLDISDEAVREGFAQVHWPGRFQVARREPPVIFDSAHNQDSFARLAEALEDYFPGKPVYLIFGASEDKNIPGMFAEIASKTKRLLVTKSAHPRALEPEQVQELARQAGVPNEAVTPVAAALRRALELSENDGSIVLSAGSMFVTAEAMSAWTKMHHSGDPARPVAET